MNRSTRTLSLLGAAAMAFAVTACGGDDSGSGSDYCDLVTSAEEDFSSLDPTDPENADAMKDVVDRFNEIADAAPEDVQEDWRTFADGYQAMSEIDMTDPAAMEELEGLEGLDAAMQNVTEHISEECDLAVEM
ncbi:hypothetical protein [Jiangella asiatica]|uniref:Uncharacterized protein n=1 Tax=Jiangella asiatica TaxID=2530372 RepID=A0A4R5CDK4_9ACTN|nr:hypothetical protein [Jiangella asiatica]TDD96380.1 hypothetical protein E1269_30570 [Jiangella asiatica]